MNLIKHHMLYWKSITLYKYFLQWAYCKITSSSNYIKAIKIIARNINPWKNNTHKEELDGSPYCIEMVVIYVLIK